MRTLTVVLLVALFAISTAADEEPFDPYASDPSDPSASGLHDVGVIDDYDNPAGVIQDSQSSPLQVDPCKALKKQKKEADKTKALIAETMEEACISDALKCAELRKKNEQFTKSYPELLKALEEHDCN